MDSKKAIKIDKGILKDTLKIAWPAMVESFFIALAAFVDTLMVSTMGEAAVGSVGLTTQPKMIALAMFFAVGVATSAVVARRFGEGRRDEANRVLITSLAFTVVGSIIVGALFFFGADFVIKVFQSNETNHDGAVVYLKIVVGAMVFNCVQIVINSALRGAGNTKITMYTNIISNTVNVIFNYLLIGGKLGFPALGIKGAAIATVLGTVVSSAISVISLIPKDRFLNLAFIVKNKIRPSLSSFLIVVKFGYGVFLEQVLLRFGFSATVIMASALNSVSVHQVGMNIVMISFAAGDGLQAAAVALIGRSLGRREPELAKTYGRCCQLIGFTI